jgi:hypothetical protein
MWRNFGSMAFECSTEAPVSSWFSSERLNPEGSRLATKPFLQNYFQMHGGEHGLSNEAADNVDFRGACKLQRGRRGWALPYTSRISVVRVGDGVFRYGQSDHGYQPHFHVADNNDFAGVSLEPEPMIP